VPGAFARKPCIPNKSCEVRGGAKRRERGAGRTRHVFSVGRGAFARVELVRAQERVVNERYRLISFMDDSVHFSTVDR
jgi:hypothetical protein